MFIPGTKTEKFFNDKNIILIGVDEAGRGPLAGPVVAGAVFLKDIKYNQVNSIKEYRLIRDSKTLSEKQRKISYDYIINNFVVGVGICSEKTIDRINILQASFLAMKMAINDLKTKIKKRRYFKNNQRYKVFVDGNKIIPNFSENQRAVVQGDKKIKSIAAASIVAKVVRDEIMKKYDEVYPEYGFAKHKGYGTKNHILAIKNNGACEIHRQSFNPIKKYNRS